MSSANDRIVEILSVRMETLFIAPEESGLWARVSWFPKQEKKTNQKTPTLQTSTILMIVSRIYNLTTKGAFEPVLIRKSPVVLAQLLCIDREKKTEYAILIITILYYQGRYNILL